MNSIVRPFYSISSGELKRSFRWAVQSTWFSVQTVTRDLAAEEQGKILIACLTCGFAVMAVMLT